MSVQGAYPQGQVTHNVVQTAAQPIIIQAPTYQQGGSSCGRVVGRLLAQPVLILGVIQVVIGILCMIFNVAGIVMGSVMAFLGHGIWCGILYILAGAFGIAAGRQKMSCYIVTCMVMSIISALASLPLLALSAIGWGQEENGGYISETSEPRNDAVAIHSVVVILGVIEGIVAIVISCLCCHAVCCCGTPGNVLVPAVGYVQGQQGMQVIFLQQQPGGSQQQQPNATNQQGYGYNVQSGGPQLSGLYQGSHHTVVQPGGPPAYSGQQAYSNQPHGYQIHVEPANGQK